MFVKLKVYPGLTQMNFIYRASETPQNLRGYYTRLSAKENLGKEKTNVQQTIYSA